MRPRRYETHDDYGASRPIVAVWEITLACNLKCSHCGSRAGTRRVGELTTSECLDVVAQLARMGVREVALIGGEAFLRRDWLEIVKSVRDHEIGLQHAVGRSRSHRRENPACGSGGPDVVRGLPGWATTPS